LRVEDRREENDKNEERFHPAECAGWGGGLAGQADPFTGMNGKEKVGLLRAK
jgi:hypothetical protein